MNLTFWNQMQNLCKEKNTTPTAVTKLLGLSTSMTTQWKNGRIPNGKTLSKIAEYFNVTTDYLLGKESTSTITFSDEEQRLILAYRNQTEEGKKMVRKLLDMEEPTNRVIDDVSDPTSAAGDSSEALLHKAFTGSGF